MAPEPLLVNENILFEAAKLYKGTVPPEYQGMQFDYEVVGWNKTTKFTVQYKNRMIKDDGVKWVPDPEGNNDELPKFTLEQVKEGLELYRKAVGRVAKHARSNVAVANEVLKKTAGPPKPEDIDMTDLNEAAARDPSKGWSSMEVLMVSLNESFSCNTLVCDL